MVFVTQVMMREANFQAVGYRIGFIAWKKF
jgi:hypothetical protein